MRAPAHASVLTRLRFAVACLFAAGLAGCASLSEEQCREGDWYQVGLADGASGAAPDRLGRHAEACAELGIVPDREQYEAGRSDGLVHYCTVSKGFEVGRNGFSYAGSCPDDRAADFLRGYTLGRRYNDVERELARIDSDLQMYRSQLGRSDLDEDRRSRIENLIGDLESQRWRVESRYRELEWELRRL
jgi:hypothetical protein